MAVEVGAGFVSVYPDTSSFKTEIEAALQGDWTLQGKGGSSSGWFSSLQTGLGVFLGNIATEIGSAIVNNMGTAINRLDTLTNYPKVMEGFGYTAEEAADSIDLIMDRLVGLPTTTQEMVQFTQALADSTGDLDLATRGALAFNDAMLASGAPLADQTRAQRIFNRIVGAGTTTTQQWSALMSVMPMQLGMTARALLGAGAGAQDLGAALMDGTVSINDILEAMVRLDTEGLDGMDSFNDQAWNMAFTLETALGLIPTRISNALAAIMQEFGRDNIMAPFLAIADGIKAGGELIVSGIRWVKETFGDDLQAIYDNLTVIGGYIGEFFSTMGGIIISVVQAAVPIIITLVEALSGLIVGALDWIAANGETVRVVLAGIVGAFLAFQAISFLQSLPILLMSVMTAIDGVKNAAFGLFAMLEVNPLVLVVTAIAGVVAALVTWITTTEEGKKWWDNLCQTAGAVFSAFGDLVAYVVGSIVTFFTKTVPDAIKGLVNKAKELFNKVKKTITDAWNNIKKTVTNIVSGLVSGVLGILGGIVGGASAVWNGIKSAASTAWNGIKSTIGGLVDGIKSTASTAWNNMKSAASTAWNSMKSTASTVWGGIKSTIGNALDGARGLAQTALSGIQGVINNLTGRTVNVTVKDGTPGGASNLVSSINNEIKKARGTDIAINVKQTGISGISVQTNYTGNGSISSIRIRQMKMAKGGTVTNPMLALIGEAGYNETVIPNTPWGVRPLARALSSEMGNSKGVTITGNTFYVRNDEDVSRVSEQLYTLIERRSGGRL